MGSGMKLGGGGEGGVPPGPPGARRVDGDRRVTARHHSSRSAAVTASQRESQELQPLAPRWRCVQHHKHLISMVMAGGPGRQRPKHCPAAAAGTRLAVGGLGADAADSPPQAAGGVPVLSPTCQWEDAGEDDGP